MKQSTGFTFFLIFLLVSCLNRIDRTEKCIQLYNNYQNNLMSGVYDSAEYYILQAIKCDSSNIQYAIELYGLRIQNEQFEKALEAIINVQKLNNRIEFKVTEELLKFEITGILDTGKIHNYFENFKSNILRKNVSEYDIFYYVVLSNFINGKNKSIEELTQYKRKVKSSSELLTMIEKLILSKDSIYVMQKAFNVR